MGYPFQCWDRIYAYANRLIPGQLPSNSAAGQRSNLSATLSIISHKKQAESKGFIKQTMIKYIFRKLPSIQKVNPTCLHMHKIRLWHIKGYPGFSVFVFLSPGHPIRLIQFRSKTITPIIHFGGVFSICMLRI